MRIIDAYRRGIISYDQYIIFLKNDFNPGDMYHELRGYLGEKMVKIISGSKVGTRAIFAVIDDDENALPLLAEDNGDGTCTLKIADISDMKSDLTDMKIDIALIKADIAAIRAILES